MCDDELWQRRVGQVNSVGRSGMTYRFGNGFLYNIDVHSPGAHEHPKLSNARPCPALCVRVEVREREAPTQGGHGEGEGSAVVPVRRRVQQKRRECEKEGRGRKFLQRMTAFLDKRRLVGGGAWGVVADPRV